MKKWQVQVRVVASGNRETPIPAVTVANPHASRPPASFVATRLAAGLQRSKSSLCYVATSEGHVEEIAQAVGALFPQIALIVLPPWDCLPYDRVPPSRHSMGRRMDALRNWSMAGKAPRLLLTSLDATLQRVPPAAVIAESRLELVAGTFFDRGAFFDFIERTGYVQEGLSDDPGEVAVREGLIDIYPAGAPGPMRIVLSEDDRIEELRGFDRLSQRTESYLDRVVFGPASEAISIERDAEDIAPNAETMERLVLRRYETMPTVFDFLGDAVVTLAPGSAERLERHLEIIEDARHAREGFGETGTSARSLYLTRDEWEQHIGNSATHTLDAGADLSMDAPDVTSRPAFARFIHDRLQQGLKVVISGTGKRAEGFCRRAEKASGMAPLAVDSWQAVLEAQAATLLKLPCDLTQGFIDADTKIALLAATDGARRKITLSTLLAEPELRIGDVIVHEEHGIGILEDLESIVVEGASRDAARLRYRDGGSVLVPMEEFGKLWRYGSEPDAVTLDCLHTDAWQKKREKIAADVQSTARYILKVVRQRQASRGEKLVPPRGGLSAFARRFPFAETADQADAIDAVLSDLASGKVMNRLVCGDVGFGKTEVALRAAAAVALCGRQVVVVAPTTVLARQHFATFERRFAGTGVSVGMLSRLLKPGEAKQVKAALAEGRIGIVVATQAVLAKDVRFAHLSLLIVDEEHRFGIKEKRAMADLAPSLHTLTMSATPIPRTLQSAMAGVQEVSLLATPPERRQPVRTSLAAFDSASIRTGLMREYRRGGQSFVVVPRIEDIDGIEKMLRKIVPELSVKVAHGKMPAAAIDETIVGFADGDGDILLATNIVENGLDVPRANSIFIMNAERFGLAQLHQLRGRVGRAGAQGIACLLTDQGAKLAEETKLRLSTLVENDRLGAGFAISLRDLDLRGGGDIAGEDQAGHMRVLGIGLYQKLLASAVVKIRKQPSSTQHRAILNLGQAGTIPADYVSDAAVRLNLYANLLRATTVSEIDDMEEEFEDRFGEPPREATLLLRTTRLQLAAGRMGFAKLEGGPKALAITLTGATPKKAIAALTKKAGAVQREDRLIIELSNDTFEKRLQLFERLVEAVS
ncbi:DEAD/DEAH box helicase [Shinella sp. M31]|uniref:DEAD/DEAH box helicase n=1 Tax=Shinella sp. M31 TaxID=3368615 RepID=UPI003B9FF532